MKCKWRDRIVNGDHDRLIPPLWELIAEYSHPILNVFAKMVTDMPVDTFCEQLLSKINFLPFAIALTCFSSSFHFQSMPLHNKYSSVRFSTCCNQTCRRSLHRAHIEPTDYLTVIDGAVYLPDMPHDTVCFCSSNKEGRDGVSELVLQVKPFLVLQTMFEDRPVLWIDTDLANPRFVLCRRQWFDAQFARDNKELRKLSLT